MQEKEEPPTGGRGKEGRGLRMHVKIKTRKRATISDRTKRGYF